MLSILEFNAPRPSSGPPLLNLKDSRHRAGQHGGTSADPLSAVIVECSGRGGGDLAMRQPWHVCVKTNRHRQLIYGPSLAGSRPLSNSLTALGTDYSCRVSGLRQEWFVSRSQRSLTLCMWRRHIDERPTHVGLTYEPPPPSGVRTRQNCPILQTGT